MKMDPREIHLPPQSVIQRPSKCPSVRLSVGPTAPFASGYTTIGYVQNVKRYGTNFENEKIINIAGKGGTRKTVTVAYRNVI